MNMLRPLNPPIRDWHGQRVWVVGASSGIGEALARALLGKGARVAMSARNVPALQSIAAEASAPERSLCVPLDVRDPAAVAAAHATIRAAWQRVDLTIWVAGAYCPMHPDTFERDAALEVIDTNLAVYNGLATLLPAFRSDGAGSLAIVSSVSGYRGLPRVAMAYGPSKAALISLAETLYLDLHPRGHGIYLINPGFVETPMTSANDFPMPGIVTPREAAQRILRGFGRGAFEIHFPRRLSMVLKFARLLPYRGYFPLIGRLTGTRQGSTTPGGGTPS